MEKQASIWKTSISYGIFYGVAAILLTVVFYVTNNIFSDFNQWIGYALMLAFVILAQLAYKKVNGGYMSIGRGVLVGMFTVVIGTLLSSIFMSIMYHAIDPTLLDQLRITMEEKMMAKGLPEEQIEAGVNMAMKFQTKPLIMILSTLLGGFLIGAIISLITALFLKKEPKIEY